MAKSKSGYVSSGKFDILATFRAMNASGFLDRFFPLGKRAAPEIPDGRAARATGRILGMVKGGSAGPAE
jgi:hypothetical protein